MPPDCGLIYSIHYLKRTVFILFCYVRQQKNKRKKHVEWRQHEIMKVVFLLQTPTARLREKNDLENHLKFFFSYFFSMKNDRKKYYYFGSEIIFWNHWKVFLFLGFFIWKKTSNEANFWSDLIAHSKIAQVSSEMHHIICWIIKYWCLENSKENTVLRCRLKVCEWTFLATLKVLFFISDFQPNLDRRATAWKNLHWLYNKMIVKHSKRMNKL